jgi:hypothetical protein
MHPAVAAAAKTAGTKYRKGIISRTSCLFLQLLSPWGSPNSLSPVCGPLLKIISSNKYAVLPSNHFDRASLAVLILGLKIVL